MRTGSALKFIVFGVCLLFWLYAEGALAQKKKKGIILVKSVPAGVMVQFEGDNSFVGITPFQLRSGLQGNYAIHAFKSGYEKRKYEYFFSGKESGAMNIRLSAKTRTKAVIRSVVFPGWGQVYSERKGSGVLVNMLQIGSLVGTVVTLKKYDNAVDEYDRALSEYRTNMKNAELRDQYWDIVVRKHHLANDSYDKSRIWLWTSVGIYIYNILDSIFFFPAFDKEMFDHSLPTISAGRRNGVNKISLTVPF